MSAELIVSHLRKQFLVGRPAVDIRGLSKRFPVRKSWRDAFVHPTRATYTPVVQEVAVAQDFSPAPSAASTPTR